MPAAGCRAGARAGAPETGCARHRPPGSVTAHIRSIVSIPLGLVLCLGCVPALAGAAAKRPARTCRVPHGQAVAVRTREAMVYKRTVRYPQGQGSRTAWTACWRRSGRRTKLNETGENPWSDSATPGPLRLAGRFLAFPAIYTSRYFESSLAVSVYDLASGRRYYTLQYWNGSEGPPLLLEAALLTRDGVVAYAVRGSGVNVYPLRTRLVAWAGRRYSVARDGVPRPLDEGPAGSITAVRLTGSTLSWRHDGAPRSATLTRPAH